VQQPKRQRGIALITALLVVAIATIAAVQMAHRQQLDIRRLQGLLAFDQAQSYAVAAESWALRALQQDLRDNETDSLNDLWAQPIVIPDYQGAQLTMTIEDLQSRFNLNNLAQVPTNEPDRNPHYERFQLLIEHLMSEHQGLDADPVHIANAVADWLDEDLEPRFPGAEDGLYLTGSEERAPYRAANRLMASPTELMLIDGMTPELYQAMLPLVTALPEPTAININTAGPRILRLAHPELSLKEAENIVLDQRPEEGWEDVKDLFALDALAGVEMPGSENEFGVQSRYFAVHATVTLGDARVTLHSLVRRHPEGRMEVLQRALGRL